MDKIKNTLDRVGDAFTVLNELFEDNAGILDNEAYPFTKPFDEVYLDFLEYKEFCERLLKQQKEESRMIPVTYAVIKRKVGWSAFAEEVGLNVYAINSYGDYEDGHLFYITLKEFEKLNL